MLSTQDYEKINRFQSWLLDNKNTLSLEKSFLQNTLGALEDIFGYHACALAFMGHLRTKTHMLPVGLLAGDGLDNGFLQDFYSTYKYDSTFLHKDPERDLEQLSQTENYTRLPVYKTLFKPHKFKDCLVKFIKFPDDECYISCLCIFSEDIIPPEETEMIDRVAQAIGHAEYSAIIYNNLFNKCLMLKQYMNNLPIGIMLIENLNQVAFTSTLAREYLREIGVDNEQFYSMFYVQELHGHFSTYNVDHTYTRPVRIKNLLFSMVSLTNPGTALDAFMTGSDRKIYPDDMLNSLRNITGCIYIIKDGTGYTRYSQSTFRSFGLTRQEAEVAEMISDGLSNREIAEKSCISENTVKGHTASIFRKLNVNSRARMISALDEMERSSHSG